MPDRDYAWDDEARVITYPEMPAAPHYHADLSACAQRAIDIWNGDPKPAKVEIEHAPGMIEMPEIELMARDASFPSDPAADRITTDSKLP